MEERRELGLQEEVEVEPIKCNRYNCYQYNYQAIIIAIDSDLLLYVGLLLRRELIIVVVVLLVVGAITIIIHGSVINS